MVTVIATKEELPTPVQNGVSTGAAESSEHERLFQSIKDYREVDFYRTPSFKPLPENFFATSKSSLKGTYLVQIDAIQPVNRNQNEQTTPAYSLHLTLTDGITTIEALTMDSIPNLNIHTKIGSKLLLTGLIPINENRMQLKHDNTRFQYGSNTFPRPKSAHRGGRTGNFSRSSYDGRRNNRYDNDDSDTKLLKRPPPKNTLMDFMTSLKISNDNEPEKSKGQSSEQSDANPIIFQQDDIEEQIDPEDDPSQVNYRERRNPLPPRLQRAQEERSRRNTIRYYDESIPGADMNAYLRSADPTSYNLNSYAQSHHLTYYPANPNPLTYGTYPTPPALLATPYPNDLVAYCYPPANYLPAEMGNGFHGDSKMNSDSAAGNDEKNDSGIKVESSSSNDNNITFQEEKRRDSNPNPRPRWKNGDMCFARWSEDGEFYPATIMAIQPPYCTVLFRDYHNYDQVHFSDLKPISRDQQFYSFIPPSAEYATAYYPSRTNYYPSTLDGCPIMPEAPPFPFNSAGTLYIYPSSSSMNSVSHSDRYESNGYETHEPQIPSSSSPSKDSNDTSGVDSTTDEHSSLPQTCSIADAPLTLVTSEDLRERSTSTESLTSSKYDEQISAKGEEEEEEEENHLEQ